MENTTATGREPETVTPETRPVPAWLHKRLIKVQGRDYLPVAYRLMWFREEHPMFGVDTKPLLMDLDKGLAVFQATVTDDTGRIVSCGTKMETVRGFADFLEKAETGAIGRALGVLGYGTQFMLDELAEGGRIVDTPQNRQGGNRQAPNRQGGRPPHVDEDGVVHNAPPDPSVCAECGRALSVGQVGYSKARFGRPLCPDHQAGQTPANRA